MLAFDIIAHATRVARVCVHHVVFRFTQKVHPLVLSVFSLPASTQETKTE